MELRKAKDEHLRTFWPLMLQCGSEDSANYVPDFVALQDALSEREIPGSCQVHLDWYSARGRTARRFTSRQRGHSAESRERHMKYDVRTSDFWWQFAKFAI